MPSGPMAEANTSPCREAEKSTSTPPVDSVRGYATWVEANAIAEPKGGFSIGFEDDQWTQADDREDALLMCVDLRATLDDRHPANYYAKWIDDSTIRVINFRAE